MLVGYMRVSTDGDRQVLDLQRDALLAAGVDERHLFEDRASGSRDDRAGLGKALAFIRAGDCLVVWKLDRLGRSLPHLLTTVTGLKERGIAFRSLTEQIDTTTPQGELLGEPVRSGEGRSRASDSRQDAGNQENGTRDNASDQAGETAPFHRSNETQAGSFRLTVQRIGMDKQSQPQSIESRVGDAEQQSKKNVTH